MAPRWNGDQHQIAAILAKHAHGPDWLVYDEKLITPTVSSKITAHRAMWRELALVHPKLLWSQMAVCIARTAYVRICILRRQ